MPEFEVNWTIQITAETPEEAAKIADNWLSEGGELWVYDVKNLHTEEVTQIDMQDYWFEDEEVM